MTSHKLDLILDRELLCLPEKRIIFNDIFSISPFLAPSLYYFIFALLSFNVFHCHFCTHLFSKPLGYIELPSIHAHFSPLLFLHFYLQEIGWEIAPMSPEWAIMRNLVLFGLFLLSGCNPSLWEHWIPE